MPLVTPKLGWKEPFLFSRREQLQEMMLEVIAQDASETIIQPGEPILLEIDGHLQALTKRRMNAIEIEHMINWAADNDKASAEIIQRREVAASYVVRDPVKEDARGDKVRYRFRVAGGRGEVNGEMAIQILMRKIDPVPAYIKEGEISQELLDACTPKDGAIWLTGPTGSGKSFFLSSLARYILENKTPIHGNLVFLESPIEQTYETVASAHSVVFQIEVGRDCLDWDEGIVQLMRRRPKMITIGETRSKVTASAVMAAAISGHATLTTSHCNDVIAIPGRILSFFDDSVKRQMLYEWVSTARVLFNQALVSRIGGGRIALREHLIMTHDLRDELSRLTDLNKVTEIMSVALKEQGCSMARAARIAYDSNQISESTFRFISKGVMNG